MEQPIGTPHVLLITESTNFTSNKRVVSDVVVLWLRLRKRFACFVTSVHTHLHMRSLTDTYNSLSVKELKKLLQDKGIDTSDCVEKSDLVKKAVDSEGLKREREEDSQVQEKRTKMSTVYVCSFVCTHTNGPHAPQHKQHGTITTCIKNSSDSYLTPTLHVLSHARFMPRLP